jgi:hypothetical protein
MSKPITIIEDYDINCTQAIRIVQFTLWWAANAAEAYYGELWY